MRERKMRRALVSVSDKTGLVPFVRLLRRFGVEILSTGGTAKHLANARIPVMDVSDVTGFPEMLDGRVKTLHPKVHGGLLARRSKPDHMKALRRHGMLPIDLVVVNLYPFEETIRAPGVQLAAAVEQIDIGGPSMVRSAAKNHESVAVVTSPNQYDWVARMLKAKGGKLSQEVREALARAAFRLTARYDHAIAQYLTRASGETGFPEQEGIMLEKQQDLRYGENPHQQAAFYRIQMPGEPVGITAAKQLQGKALSYNNIMDADAAWRVAQYFSRPTAVVMKHANPCGVGTARSIRRAYEMAYRGDPVSAFGGIVAVNRPLDVAIAKQMAPCFLEVVVAPAFAKGALRVLKKKKNLRLLEVPNWRRDGKGEGIPLFDYRPVLGGLLLQDLDQAELTMSDVRVVTKREPTLGELEDLFFAWGVVKHVKSNAIVIAAGGETLGIGAGQMSRVDAVEIAIRKMKKRPKHAVLASDAFFPFPDSIELASQQGITAVIQPGGSIRDREVIAAANRHGIAMVFTGRRHFRH